MNNRPVCLNYKVFQSKEHGVKYIKDHTGRHFSIHSDRYEDSPVDLDTCMERSLQPSDIHTMVIHGLLGDADYDLLNEKGLITPTVSKLWHLIKELKSKVQQIEEKQPVREYTKEEIDALPDDEFEEEVEDTLGD